MAILLELRRGDRSHVLSSAVLSAVVALIGLNSPLNATESDFFDSIEAPTESVVQQNLVPKTAKIWAELGYRLHYALEDKPEGLDFQRPTSGVALSRADMRLRLDWQVSELLSIRTSARGVENGYSNEPSRIEVDESYISYGGTQGLKYRLGRQFAIFGESDFFQVSDVVNPSDQRELGLAELDETRLPVLASRFSYVGERWGADLVLLHEYRPNRLAASRGDFDPYISLGGRQVLSAQPEPVVDFSDSDIVARLFSSRSWGDISVVYADKYQYHSSFVGYMPGQEQPLVLGVAKVKTVGLAANYISGNWVFKADYAYRDGALFLPRDIATRLHNDPINLDVPVEKPVHELVLGFRYSGVSNLSLNVELYNRKINTREPLLAEPHLTTTSMTELTWQAMQDRLRSSLLWAQWWGQDNSGFVRLSQEYDINDAIVLSAGYINYYGGAGDIFDSISHNSRMFVSAKYSF